MARSTTAAGPAGVPGPAGLPVFGCALAYQRNPLQLLTRVARRHGPAAHIPMLRRRQVYLLSAPEASGQVLVTHAANYTSRELNLPATAFLGDGLLSLDGEDHRRQHALVQPAFGRRRVEAYAPDMLEGVERPFATWSDGGSVELHGAMQRLTLALVARAIFDVDPAGGGGRPQFGLRGPAGRAPPGPDRDDPAAAFRRPARAARPGPGEVAAQRLAAATAGPQPHRDLRPRWRVSTRQRQVEDLLAEVHRRLAEGRNTSQGTWANQVLGMGDVFQVEKVSYRAFQRAFGRSVGRRAPGMFVER